MNDDVVVRRAVADPVVVSADEGRFRGRIVPWGEAGRAADPDGSRYLETFERNSLVAEGPVYLYGGHDPLSLERGPLIGRAEALESRDDGLWADFVVADTSAGRDARALARVAAPGLSIEFRPNRAGEVWDRARRAVLRTQAAPSRLTGVALVFPPDSPAFASAAVTEMRADPSPEEVPTVNDVPLTVADTPATPDLEVARSRAATDTLNPTPVRVVREALPGLHEIPSYGHYVHAVARALVQGDHDAPAVRLMRALQTNILDATNNEGLVPGDSWIREVKGMVATGRVLINALGTVPLPSVGMTISYPTVAAVPSVAAQANQGDEVSSSTAFEVGIGTGTVATYAGGQTVSLQLALRSEPGYLDLLYRMFALQYAKATNTAFWTAVNTAATGTEVAQAPGTSDAGDYWTALVAAAKAVMVAAPYLPPEVVIMAPDVWEVIAKFVDSSKRPIFPAAMNGPQNAPGTNTLAGPGNLGGLKWLVDPGAPTGAFLVTHTEAAKWAESPGAPFQLQIEKPATLQHDAAIFGFGTTMTFYSAALRKITNAS